MPGSVDELQIIGVEGLLDIAASPYKPPQNVVGSAFSTMESPVRADKRPRATPHSPGTALLIEAAKATEARGSPVFIARGLAYALDSPETSLLECGPLDFVAPPSPARTPSRLLFSPKARPSPGMRSGVDSSPATAMRQRESDELIGSIWKHSTHSEEHHKKKSTARRPLLGSDDEYDDESLQYPNDDPTPPPAPMISDSPAQRTPIDAKGSSRIPRSTGGSSAGKESSSKKLGRKSYSTAGRPRVRGKYKCGKCGFHPKTTKHDCDAEIQKKAKAQREASGSKCDDTSGAFVTPSPLRNSASRLL